MSVAVSQPNPVPEIEQATTFTAVIAAEPVLILLPRMRAVNIAESGTLVTADAGPRRSAITGRC